MTWKVRSSMEEETGKIGCAVAIVILLAFVLILGIDWLITCGIIKLICMCFGWTFTWSTATGVWLIITMVEGALGSIKVKG